MQKKTAVRILVKGKCSGCCRDIFKQRNILIIPAVYILTCAIYERNHLGVKGIIVTYHKLTTTQQSIAYWGPKIYNNLQKKKI